MPDRLGQEKDKKRSKTLLTIAGVLIGLNIVLFLLVPTQRNVSYDGEAVIYSVSDESYEKTCAVKIKGFITQSVLLTDTFQAEFYISDVPGMTEDMRLYLQRKDGCWTGCVQDASGQPVGTGVWDVEATKDFEHITVAFATGYEKTAGGVERAFDPDSATFLSLGAPNRAYALRQYQELILKQK